MSLDINITTPTLEQVLTSDNKVGNKIIRSNDNNSQLDLGEGAYAEVWFSDGNEYGYVYIDPLENDLAHSVKINLNAPSVQKNGSEVETQNNKGQANGYASLNGSGIIPSSQLPTHIDEVQEYADVASFPVTGISDIIYVSLATNETYRWSGSAYVKLNDGAVSSFNSRTGAILPLAGDYDTSKVADTLNKRYVTDAEKTVIGNTSGVNTGNETTTTEGALINSATSKATPVDADYIGLMDSAASNILKKLSWSNIKSNLQTFFDTIYLLKANNLSGLTNTTTARTNLGVDASGTPQNSKMIGYQNTDSSVTGTLTETILCSILIPANSMGVNDVLDYNAGLYATGVAGTKSFAAYIGPTNNSLTGASTCGRVQLAAANTSGELRRKIANKNSQTTNYVALANTNSGSGEALSNIARIARNYDFTVAQYFMITCALANTGDTGILGDVQLYLSKP